MENDEVDLEAKELGFLPDIVNKKKGFYIEDDLPGVE